MSRLRICISALVVAIGLACLVISLSASLPVSYSILMTELSVESFTRPALPSRYVGGGYDSPRYFSIYRLCADYPEGSIGIDLRTYGPLPGRERKLGNELCYIGFENIVRTTGQPIRFDRTPPPSVRYVLRFMDPNRTANDPKPIVTFVDMGLFAIGAQR